MQHPTDQMGRLIRSVFFSTNEFRSNFICLFSCVAIISTDSIKIGRNETIRVGNCDSGPISYTLKQNKNPGIWQHFSRNVRICKKCKDTYIIVVMYSWFFSPDHTIDISFQCGSWCFTTNLPIAFQWDLYCSKTFDVR